VTSMVTEQVGAPWSTRGLRRLDRTRDSAVDRLAERTVWCATVLPEGGGAARSLRTSLRSASDGRVASGPLEVSADEQLRALARRLVAMLRGEAAPGGDPSPADEEVYGPRAGAGDALAGSEVRRDDVVVLQDPLTAALLAQDVRERGAHAVWQVGAMVERPEATERAALELLRAYTSALDAYVVTWVELSGRGVMVERMAALMPSAGIVAAKEVTQPGEVAGDELSRDVGWSSLLADVVQQDRGETVGGRLHARPAVALR
jgi:hypothetical protein